MIQKLIKLEADCVVIDGQLNYSINDVNGWRTIDHEMREIENIEIKWIQSSNSLMAVPTASRIIAEYLRPHCATLFETHPRVYLFQKFKVDEKLLFYVKHYKSADTKAEKRKMTKALSENWMERMKIQLLENPMPLEEGRELDSLVCASLGATYFIDKSLLKKLSVNNTDLRGYGPLYLLS